VAAVGYGCGFTAAFRRKKAVHPGYSLRALARDLGVSPAFVSNVFSGKRKPPRDRLEKLCYSLELDVLEKEVVIKALVLDPFSAKVVRAERRLRRKAREERETLSKSPGAFLSALG